MKNEMLRAMYKFAFPLPHIIVDQYIGMTQNYYKREYYNIFENIKRKCSNN